MIILAINKADFKSKKIIIIFLITFYKKLLINFEKYIIFTKKFLMIFISKYFFQKTK